MGNQHEILTKCPFRHKRKTEIRNRFVFLIMVLMILMGEIYLYVYVKKVELTFQPLIQSKKQTVKTAVPKINLPSALYNLAGIVKNYDKNSIILEATIPQLDENGKISPKIEIRKVLILPITKFSSLSFISQEGISKQTPVENSVTLKEIQVGGHIEVISNQDISQKEEFEVTQIRILPK